MSENFEESSVLHSVVLPQGFNLSLHSFQRNFLFTSESGDFAFSIMVGTPVLEPSEISFLSHIVLSSEAVEFTKIHGSAPFLSSIHLLVVSDSSEEVTSSSTLKEMMPILFVLTVVC